METLEKIKEDLKKNLSEERYNHSVGTSNAAAELAELYGIDSNIAALTGLTHDIAKEIPNEEKLNYVKENNIEIDEIEAYNPRFITCKSWFRYSKEKIWIYRRNAKCN